ncbi:MAG TPA: biopolymer transporter ExbD [Anaeromyxobacteraceae bacterium]|nr:biopolymer transporter ExbD [Anaeromyxobacteraceae bacterium]
MRRHVRHDEDTGELNIIPYLDIVTNLVMFMLLSMTGLISLGVLNVSAPKLGGEAAAGAAVDPQAPKLLLTVAIGKQGFYVAGAGGVLGADAGPAPDAARPPTIPLRDGKYDYAALTTQLAVIKDKFPNETQVILSADPDVQYDTLVQTMDACRESAVKKSDGSVDRRPLFFDVSLSLIG